MNKLIALGFVAALAIPGLASAHMPTVTLDPIGALEYAVFPQVYDVTGTVSHSAPGNVSSISELRLFINNVQEGLTVNPNFGNDPSAAFSLPWNILAPGVYTVKVTAKHGGTIGDDSEVVEVTEIELPPVVITECPAAPAIAGAYMRSHSPSIKEGSANWKKVMNAIAKRTGSGGDLWAARACEQTYPNEVRTAVNGMLGW